MMETVSNVIPTDQQPIFITESKGFRGLFAVLE